LGILIKKAYLSLGKRGLFNGERGRIVLSRGRRRGGARKADLLKGGGLMTKGYNFRREFLWRELENNHEEVGGNKRTLVEKETGPGGDILICRSESPKATRKKKTDHGEKGGVFLMFSLITRKDHCSIVDGLKGLKKVRKR